MDVLSIIGLLVSYYTRYVSKSFEITSMKYPRRFSFLFSCTTVAIQLGRSLIRNSKKKKKKKKVNIKGELWGVLIKSSCLVRFFIIFFFFHEKYGNLFSTRKISFKIAFYNFWKFFDKSVDRSIIETVDNIESMVCNWAIIGRSVVNDRSMIIRSRWSIDSETLIGRCEF